MVASLFVRNLGKFLVFLPLKLLVERCNQGVVTVREKGKNMQKNTEQWIPGIHIIY